MPGMTRQMFTTMNSSSAASGSSTKSGASSHKSHARKRVREYPSSMDPGTSRQSSSSSTSCSRKSSATSTSPTGSLSSSGGSGSAASSGSGTGVSSSSRKSCGTSVSGGTSKKSSATTMSKSRPKSSQASLTGHSKGSKHSHSKSSHSNKSHSSHSASSNASSIYSSAVQPVSVAGFDTKQMTMDERKIKFIQNQLQNNVKRLHELTATEPAGSEFAEYTIDESNTVAEPHSCVALFAASHKDYPSGLVAKVYNADTAALDNQSSIYLKVLRHLGKKHGSIIHTMGVYSREQNIYLIQALAPHGNMANFVAQNGALDPTQAQTCAKQVRSAMDFMGDMGLCHRAISPRHLLLCHTEMDVKLTGFRSALVYYDEKNNDINYQPCLALSSTGPETEFQALEVFGDPSSEVFDPVAADVWSYGASIYYLLTGQYPFPNRDDPEVENTIQNNVRALKVSNSAHNLLGHCLTTNSTERFSVEQLLSHPWLAERMSNGSSSHGSTSSAHDGSAKSTSAVPASKTASSASRSKSATTAVSNSQSSPVSGSNKGSSSVAVGASSHKSASNSKSTSRTSSAPSGSNNSGSRPSSSGTSGSRPSGSGSSGSSSSGSNPSGSNPSGSNPTGSKSSH